MTYTIRRATVNDLPPVIELAVDMVVHSISPYRAIAADAVREFRRRDLVALHDAVQQPHVGLFVAEDMLGRLLGHVIIVCGYMESSTGEAQGWIFDLSVIPEMWDQGVGRGLMERAELFCKEQGYRYLGLGVTSANKRAVGFYEKLGYEEERERMIKCLDVDVLAIPPAAAPAVGD